MEAPHELPRCSHPHKAPRAVKPIKAAGAFVLPEVEVVRSAGR